jgi:hypothetical protein
MQSQKWRFLLLVPYSLLAFGIVNLSFPIHYYFTNFTYSYSKRQIVSGFVLLILVVTLLTALALPFSRLGKKPLWSRVAIATVLQFFLVSAFAIACSGLGFGWSVSGTTILQRLGFFFAEWEWTRFIFEAAVPLAACAAFLYWITGRDYSPAG